MKASVHLHIFQLMIGLYYNVKFIIMMLSLHKRLKTYCMRHKFLFLSCDRNMAQNIIFISKCAFHSYSSVCVIIDDKDVKLAFFIIDDRFVKFS